MKKLLIVLLVLVLLIAGAIGYAFYNANSLIETFRPQLEKTASDVLGTKVALGKIETSFASGVSLKIDEVKVGDTSDVNAFSLKNLLLDLSTMPLFEKKLVIDNLKIDKPQVTLVKRAEGIEIVGLPKKPKSNTAPAAATPAQPATLPLGIQLKNISISDATIIFKDETANKEYRVSDVAFTSSVDVAGNDVTLPQMTVKAKLLNALNAAVEAKNITFGLQEGKLSLPQVAVQLLGGTVAIAGTMDTKQNSGAFDINAKDINLTEGKALHETVPALKDLAFAGIADAALKATLGAGGAYGATGTATLRDLKFDKPGLAVSGGAGVVNINATQEAQEASSDNFALTYNGAPIKAKFSAKLQGTALNIPHFEAQAFGGTTSGSAQLALDEAKAFVANIALAGLSIEQALAAVAPGSGGKLGGTLSRVAVNVRGALGPNLMQSLNGAVQFNLINAALKDVNLAGMVLKEAKDIPLVQGSLYAIAPERFKASIAAADTRFDSLTGGLTIAGGRMNVKNLVGLNPVFKLEGDGIVGFDSSLDFNAAMYFTPDFSLALTSSIRELQAALDKDSQLAVPLTIRGVPPTLVVIPNFKKVIEIAGKKIIKQQAEKLLEKVVPGGSNLKGVTDLLGF